MTMNNCGFKRNLILVDLEKTDISGMRFYIKNGFEEVANIDHWFGKNKSGTILTKWIEYEN